MLEIIIPAQEYHKFNENTEEFYDVKIEETKLRLEHSLVSLKKWEQKWKKAFLKNSEKTYEEIVDYIRCMALNDDVDPDIYWYIPKNLFDKIIDYIQDPMTATWFNDNNMVGAQRHSRETVTAEIIYYWMIMLNIPVEFQYWHLNQLLTLIKVVNIKLGGPKKVNKRDAARERARLNAQRRAAHNSRG